MTKLVALLFFLIMAPLAVAASLQVSPVYIEMTGNIEKITLFNTSDKPVFAQIRAFDWAVVNNVDQLLPTKAILASPPQIKIAANGQQVVRIARVASQPLQHQETYRLFVDELTDASTAPQGVLVQLRYSVPVFVTPPAASAAEVQIKARIENGELVLDVQNSGVRYARVGRIELLDAAGSSQVVSDGLLGYVFGQSSRLWRLPLVKRAAALTPARIQLNINGLPVSRAF